MYYILNTYDDTSTGIFDSVEAATEYAETYSTYFGDHYEIIRK